jgi:hypothetical protein
VRDNAREVLDVLEKLQILVDPQVELLLLRFCLGIRRLTHVLRCSLANCIEAGVALFDAGQWVALRRIVLGEGEGFGPLQDEIAAIPIAAGAPWNNQGGGSCATGLLGVLDPNPSLAGDMEGI